MEGARRGSGLTACCSLKQKAGAESGMGPGRPLEESEGASAALSWLLSPHLSDRKDLFATPEVV